MILTLFLQGAVSQIHAFFHHRFLDLSLISRFPISGVFCTVHGEIVYPAANNILFQILFNRCNSSAVGWGDNGGRSPLCFCTVLDFTLFKKEIEMDKSHKG